jgi:hypothetical protein
MVLSSDIRNRYIFEYTTLSRIRAEGITSSSLSDADCRALIRHFSKVINNVTGQWFWPLEYTERMNGKGFPLISHPSSIPLLEIRSVSLQSSAGINAYLSEDFVVHDRDIELISFFDNSIVSYYYNAERTAFSKTRPLNVLADGTFGWLENRPFVPYDQVAKISTTFSTTVSNGDTTMTVADSTGFKVNDVIVIRSGAAGATYAGHAILTSVSSGTLGFDALNLNTDSVASGNVVTYGQIPDPVSRACAILVIRFMSKLSQSVSGSTVANVANRIIRERTDQYEYQLSQDLSTTSGSLTTGDIEADRLLQTYCAPPYLGFV